MKGRPDFEWTTSVKAKEVTFGKLSDERKVTYAEEPDAETEVTVERENIPEDPEVGVTYRDVKIDWTVLQRIVHPIEEDDDSGEQEDSKPSSQ